jgi:hypothetical protein
MRSRAAVLCTSQDIRIKTKLLKGLGFSDADFRCILVGYFSPESPHARPNEFPLRRSASHP